MAASPALKGGVYFDAEDELVPEEDDSWWGNWALVIAGASTGRWTFPVAGTSYPRSEVDSTLVWPAYIHACRLGEAPTELAILHGSYPGVRELR